MDTGKEAGLEWNTSEISASTSVFDVTQSQSEELNYTVMSELAFGSSVGTASCSTVPTQESIIADTLAAWEHEDFVPENITTSGKHANGKTSKSRKRKHRQSISPKQSFLSETSEDSINYSAIQSAALLPMVNQINLSLAQGNLNHPVPNSSPNNISLNNNTSLINQTSIKLPQLNNQGRTENNQSCQISFNSSGSGDTSCTSESQLNSTYLSSQNSSLVSNSSSNQSVGEQNPPLISSTQPANKKNARKSTLPSLPEEVGKKQLNVPPKEAGKKKATKAPPKTKTKATQANIKTKAPKTNAGPKKTTGKKVYKKKLTENKKVEQENNQQIADNTISDNIIPENDLNVNLGEPSDFEIKSKETLLKEKVEELLNMPSTTRGITDINNTIGTVDINMNHTVRSVDLDQTASETLVSQSCSIEIVKEKNRASKINIILPPETNLSLTKNNPTNVKSKRNSLPASKVKKDSLSADNDTPKLRKINIKKEKVSPKAIDLTSEAHPSKTKRQKEHVEDNKRHSKKSGTQKNGNKKHGRTTPEHQTKRQTIACGYVSSGSSDESDSSDYSSSCSCGSSCSCSYGSSSSCSCSDCANRCDCSFCSHSTSCSCSSCCSESSYDSPVRRRRHR